MSQGVCKYRVDPGPVFLFAYITGSIGCSLFVVSLAIFDPAFAQAKTPVVLETIGYVLVFFGPPYAALCALVLTHYFQYEVTPEGVQGQNWLGRTVLVKWSEVAAAKPLTIGNLEFVRLSTPSGTRVWLPMFVHSAASADAPTFAWAPPHPMPDPMRAPIVREGRS